jgi:hypothetical protein
MTTLAPIDLHSLGRLIMDFLIDRPADGPNCAHIAADGARATSIPVGTTGDLLVDTYRRELRIAGQDSLDLGLVLVQEAGAVRSLMCGGLFQLERRGHRAP